MDKGTSRNNTYDLICESSGAIKAPGFFENSTTVEPLLTTKELANKLDCSVSYIRKLKRQGKIRPHVNFNRFIRYKYTDVVASLKKWGIST